MDNTRRVGAGLAVCVNVRHYVVTHFLLPRLGNREIYIVHIGFKLINLFLCNIQPQLHFRSCQSHPKATEGTKLFLL